MSETEWEEWFEERAAIAEHLGKLTKEEAEKAVRAELARKKAEQQNE